MRKLSNEEVAERLKKLKEKTQYYDVIASNAILFGIINTLNPWVENPRLQDKLSDLANTLQTEWGEDNNSRLRASVCEVLASIEVLVDLIENEVI